MNASRTLILFIIVLLAGCRTADIRKIETIAVPPGLTPRDVKAAIVLAVAPEPPVEGSTWEKMVDAALAAKIGSYKRQLNRPSGWFVESIESSAVVLGIYDDDDRYLRVRLGTGSSVITPTIDGSSNMKQSAQTIHRDALVWIDQLSVRVRASLGRFSIHNESLAAPPAARRK